MAVGPVVDCCTRTCLALGRVAHILHGAWHRAGGRRSQDRLRDRARARHRPQAAVSIRGLRARRVLRHRRAGRRLLRPLHAVLRPRPHRVPPPPRPRAPRRRRLRDARGRASSTSPARGSTTCSRSSFASSESGAPASPTTMRPTGSTRRRQADGDRKGNLVCIALDERTRGTGAGHVPRADRRVPAVDLRGAPMPARARQVAELFGGGHVVHLSTLRADGCAAEPPASGRSSTTATSSSSPSRRARRPATSPTTRASRCPSPTAATPTAAPGCAAGSAQVIEGDEALAIIDRDLRRVHRRAVPDAQRQRLRRRRRGPGLGDAAVRGRLTTSARVGAPSARALPGPSGRRCPRPSPPSALVVGEETRGRAIPGSRYPASSRTRSLDRGITMHLR